MDKINENNKQKFTRPKIFSPQFAKVYSYYDNGPGKSLPYTVGGKAWIIPNLYIDAEAKSKWKSGHIFGQVVFASCVMTQLDSGDYEN